MISMQLNENIKATIYIKSLGIIRPGDFAVYCVYIFTLYVLRVRVAIVRTLFYCWPLSKHTFAKLHRESAHIWIDIDMSQATVYLLSMELIANLLNHMIYFCNFPNNRFQSMKPNTMQKPVRQIRTVAASYAIYAVLYFDSQATQNKQLRSG